jgi:hypothetical protein
MNDHLTEDESGVLWVRVAAAWDIRPGFYYPLDDASSRRDLLALETSLFRTAGGVDKVRSALDVRGVRGCFEFGEFDIPTKRVSVRDWSVASDGREHFWTAEPFDWLLYLSHEESLTLGGSWLIEVFKRSEPAWRDLLWKSSDPRFVHRSA